MRPAYLTCIKDEPNLIYYNLKYYYNIGIRDFYIMFNNSKYITHSEVNRFLEEKKDIKYKLYEDPDIAYRQPDRFKKMSDQAFSDGCDWMIPIDADEIIKINGYKKIQDVLKAYEPVEFGYIICSWIDYQPTPYDNKNDENIFTRWKYRNPEKRPVSKIIVKWHPDMRWGDGHHLIVCKRKDLGRTKVLIYAHFPNRSKEQLRKKIITIGEAFIKTFGRHSERNQVVKYNEWKRHGEKVFNELWQWIENYRAENIINFKFDPISENLFK